MLAWQSGVVLNVDLIAVKHRRQLQEGLPAVETWYVDRTRDNVPMSNAPYAIRKGFEYQDLVCAQCLLQLIKNYSLDLGFSLESDEVEHADPRTILTYIRSRDRLSKSPAYVLNY